MFFFREYFVTFLVSIQSLETILGLMENPLGVSWTNLKTNLQSFGPIFDKFRVSRTNLGQIQSLSDQSWTNLESLGPILNKFRVSRTNLGQIQSLSDQSWTNLESLGPIMDKFRVSWNHLVLSWNKLSRLEQSCSFLERFWVSLTKL